MKLDMYEMEETDGNIIKIWFEPETPEETRLLDKLKIRLEKTDPNMLKFIAGWFDKIDMHDKDSKKTPIMLFKFPQCWEVK